MSTWISDAVRAAALAALTGLLSACMPDGGLTGAGPSRVTVAGGAVTVAGPPGYCVDRDALRDASGNAFAMLLRCAPGGTGAVLTATVLGGAPTSQPLVAAFPEMAVFFRSDTGRAALSRSGRAADVAIIGIAPVKDVLYLHLTDASAGTGPAVAPGYWRAIFTLRGRIVTLSVLGRAAAPMAGPDQKRLLDAFVARVRRENPVAART